MLRLVGWLLAMVGVCITSPLWAQNQAQEAYSEGARFINRREFDKARAPLETALQLAPDNAFRLKVFQRCCPSIARCPRPTRCSKRPSSSFVTPIRSPIATPRPAVWRRSSFSAGKSTNTSSVIARS